jgi:hypothetical protein
MLDAGKISQAVTDCLSQCYASELPLSALAEFLGRLTHDPAWNAYEVEAVEIRVLRVLNRIASESDEFDQIASSADPIPLPES